MWRYYFENTDAVIFVVDSADSSRLAEAKKELDNVLTYNHLFFVKVINK
jgi:signal recognition particle receptor subunit beta